MTQIYCTNIFVSLRKYQIILILCRIGGDGVGTPAATAHPHNGTGRGVYCKIQASATINRSAIYTFIKVNAYRQKQAARQE